MSGTERLSRLNYVLNTYFKKSNQDNQNEFDPTEIKFGASVRSKEEIDQMMKAQEKFDREAVKELTYEKVYQSRRRSQRLANKKK